MKGNTINKKIKSNGGEMSKIDVLIIVHSEHEGLLSVGNSEHAHYGMVARESVIRLPVNPVIWQTGIPAFIPDSFNTFNPNFPKKSRTGKLLVLL